MATQSATEFSIILNELRALRRDIDLFLPTEKLSEYKNAGSIKKAYENAREQFSQESYVSN